MSDYARHFASQPCMSDLPPGFPGRAEVERAAANRRNLLLVAPPGVGTTMLARRIPTILPDPSEELLAEISAAYRAARLIDADESIPARPMRAPHYTCSAAALVGTVGKLLRHVGHHGEVEGGYCLRVRGHEGACDLFRAERPGEAALAHGGVLLLDDLGEFRRDAVERLAHVLAAGVDKAGFTARPAMVVGTCAPCPCGWRGSQMMPCACTGAAVARHQQCAAGLAGMLGLEDLELPALALEGLRGSGERGEPSQAIRERIAAAWAAEVRP